MPTASLRVSSLLSSLPPLPLPTKNRSPPTSFLPPLPPPSPWRKSFFPFPISSSALVQCPTEVTVSADDKGGILNSCFPSLARANIFYAKGGRCNAQVVVGDDEPEEVLLRRFKREVMKAGVIQECKRRRWFENTQEKKKRKTRDAARKNRKRHYQPKVYKQDKQEEPKGEKQEEDEDNWVLPEGDLPYCNRLL